MYVTYLPLQLWKKHWGLEGPLVVCRSCGYVQHFTSNVAFNHAQDCVSNRIQAQYPHRELGKIVAQKIRAGLF